MSKFKFMSNSLINNQYNYLVLKFCMSPFNNWDKIRILDEYMNNDVSNKLPFSKVPQVKVGPSSIGWEDKYRFD